MFTKYHSKYYATELTLKRPSDSIEKLTASLSDAKVDLNPHQVDAALFAFRSPLSNGVILADEVGLGKTIEAGIVISQKWAERKRKILLIVPASLRKQWFTELDEKFFIKSTILDKKSFDNLKKKGNANPFDISNRVVICSYHYASQMNTYIQRIKWDLVVVDEAHRLRNVYKKSNKISNNIKNATKNSKKLLLTATPLQNNLLELYGLSSFIDEHVFGDVKSFKNQYMRIDSEDLRNTLLRKRLNQFCKRTLRKQVQEYVPYTKRISIVQEYYPSVQEQCLYEGVTEYLTRDKLYALPSSQRKLMTLILRKLLASSSQAISGTLKSLIIRLENLINNFDSDINLDDYDNLDEVKEEWNDEIENENFNETSEKEKIYEELELLKKYYKMACEISENTKGKNLLIALDKGFEKADELGATRKAVIFTESKRTQEYLFNLLSDNGYKDKVILMNGQNTDKVSKLVYNKWLEKHHGEETITGSRPADIKSAIVEEFKNNANILIATEAASEGINLQFCSLVVNFDLPWNPQRIEQRIGRCHRYGQKYDVVVVNFLNKKNEADIRVYKLLSEKFQLFDGIFGASDEVLGTIESGVDFEKKIATIYQECRTKDEIKEAFDNIQKNLEDDIEIKMKETRKSILENFDEEVQQKLKSCEEETNAKLSEYEKWILKLEKCELKEDITIDKFNKRFYYSGSKYKSGWYNLNWKNAEENKDIFLRSKDKILQDAINQSLSRKISTSELNLYYSRYKNKISFFENLKCKSGWLSIDKVSFDAFEKEEYLIFSAVSDEGENFDEDMARKLLILESEEIEEIKSSDDINLKNRIDEMYEYSIKSIQERNLNYFKEECDKLNDWAEDLKQNLEVEIKDLDKEIKEMKRNSKDCTTLEETIQHQKQIKSIEKKRNDKRRNLFIEQDEIDRQRDELVEQMEEQLKSEVNIENVIKIKWNIV